ncbi:MAG: hypothetical protein EHM47_08135 [Ignavibacteriales bacterium]|nr:MAG: hypothetical protein EHM47_08135 [Ignavibacteriales bacterium]
MKKQSDSILVKLFFAFILITGMISVNGQSLSNLENRYRQLNNQYDKEIKILDSLRSIYTYRTSQIDAEKKKKNPDNERVIELMSGSVSISNKIEAQNKRIVRIENDIENIKQQLHKIYVSKIDSLELLKTGSEDEARLNAEILLLTEKNILVAPKILSLSFNPEKILVIDLNGTKDAKEKSLYKEYLNSALSEVNDVLKKVSLQISEIDQIIALQTKTKKFLEEAELESNMIIQNQRSTSPEIDVTNSPAFRESDGVTTSSDFVSNIKTYQFILRQLDIQQLSKTDLKLNISLDEMSRNLDVKEYQKLLNEVKERLQEFKLVLANKIGSSK